MTIDIKRTVSLDAPLSVEPLHGVAFMAEHAAHKFTIACYQDGSHVSLTGSVTARFLRADGTTVDLPSQDFPDLTGIDVNGDAFVILHQLCYAVSGRFQLSIFNVHGTDSTTCIYSCVGSVQRTSSGSEVVPGTTVPDYSTMAGIIEECEDAAEDARTAAATAVSYAEQTGKTDAQKAQARANIGAADSGEVSDLKSALNVLEPVATSADVGKFLKAKTVENGKVTEYEFSAGGSGSGLTADIKTALLACFSHVAWVDDNGQDYYDALNAALNPPASLTSIDAVYTQSGTVYSGASLDTLKNDLVVTAYYDGGDSEVLSPSAYTLSGTLAAGTSIVTVTFGGKTDTFSVQVTGSSGMDGWTDGVAYRNLEIVQNEYCRASDGAFVSFNGWDRTGYVPCDGAGSITFPPYTGASNVSECGSNRFFDQSHNAIGTQIILSPTETKTITVPSGAYYFALSCKSAPLAACINAGIIPHEAGV